MAGLSQSDKAQIMQAGVAEMTKGGWAGDMLRGWQDLASRKGVKFLRLYRDSLKETGDSSDMTKVAVGVEMLGPDQAFWPNAVERGFGGNPPEFDKTGDTSYILNDLILKGRPSVNVPFTKSARTVAAQASQALRAGGMADEQQRVDTVRPLMQMARRLAPTEAGREREYGDRMAAGHITLLKPHHKADMMAGMVRLQAPYAAQEGKTTKQAPEDGFRIWRRITQNSAPWVHPGFKAQHVGADYQNSSEFQKLCDDMGSAVIDAMAAAVARILKQRAKR